MKTPVKLACNVLKKQISVEKHVRRFKSRIKQRVASLMEIEPLEVFARDSNYAVIKPPGRQYPGCVIQGDSLAILCRMAMRIADFARSNEIADEDVLENIQELNNALVGRLLHYQDVLLKHGIDFPHVHAFSETDLVTLLPDYDDTAE